VTIAANYINALAFQNESLSNLTLPVGWLYSVPCSVLNVAPWSVPFLLSSIHYMYRVCSPGHEGRA
jgi:hypothetical protein